MNSPAIVVPNDAPVIVPLSLSEAPSLIERLWPAQKISVEAQKERKANLGQTLTSLGSYWKGRKPLVLVRACVLGALLPATDDPEKDLAIFEMLMGIDDEAFITRTLSHGPNGIAKRLVEGGYTSPGELRNSFTIRGWDHSAGSPSVDDFEIAYAARRLDYLAQYPARHEAGRAGNHEKHPTRLIPYADRVAISRRPEELEASEYNHIWPAVNGHLNTSAHSLPSLVEQLGIMRFGHRPRVADMFAGGGSIPFEAARVGCDVYASDLNPIACMLTWGAMNIIGADPDQRARIESAQIETAAAMDELVTRLGFEHDEAGNRAKAYLYCIETECPSSGWMVPMLPSLVISKSRNVIARLVPMPECRRYEIAIDTGVSASALLNAEMGTVQDGSLVHKIDGVEHRTSIKSLRGDWRKADGSTGNSLRQWSVSDFVPQPGDTFQERLYCVHWIGAETIHDARQRTFFLAPTAYDLKQERRVEDYVRESLGDWQARGLVPDMPIEPGEKTDEPIRTRGWTHWHHLFGARHLLIAAHTKETIANFDPHTSAALLIVFCRALNVMSRMSRWSPAVGHDLALDVFYNQALNTFLNYGSRASISALRDFRQIGYAHSIITTNTSVVSHPADRIQQPNDVYITDPPYADAVHYQEITEFFIAWARKQPPQPFAGWTWDSRRALAIKGDGEQFRREMVAAYTAMTRHMPDNGIQIVMFTHQSGSVWADLAQIFWGAGLQVQAAWYIATETSSQLKKGGYVQGTVILVLRKRRGGESGYEDEIAQEVRAEVARQLDTLVGLNQSLKGSGRTENLFEDADLQMAGYAAALRVLTGYTQIDGRDMTAEAIRPRRKGEKGFVERIIDYAVQVANEHMVPGDLPPRLWQQLSGTERFYLKMIDLETAGLSKLDNYQNFARAFRVPDYSALMADMRPNSARVKRADDLKHRTGFDIPEFGTGLVRAALYGIFQLATDADADGTLEQLRGMVENYYRRRTELIEIVDYIAVQRGRDDEREGRAATVLGNLLRNERLG